MQQATAANNNGGGGRIVNERDAKNNEKPAQKWAGQPICGHFYKTDDAAGPQLSSPDESPCSESIVKNWVLLFMATPEVNKLTVKVQVNCGSN